MDIYRPLKKGNVSEAGALNLILNQSPYNYLADINNDNSINIQDVIMIVQIILNG